MISTGLTTIIKEDWRNTDGQIQAIIFVECLKIKCYAILLSLCQELYGQHIDYIVEMLVKLIDKAEKTAKNQIDEATKKKRRDIKKVLEQFQTISKIILDNDITDDTLRKTIYKAVSRKKLAKQVGD